MIETQIWNKIPNQPGKVEYAGQRKIGEVFKDLCEFLKAENIYPEEEKERSGHSPSNGLRSIYQRNAGKQKIDVC